MASRAVWKGHLRLSLVSIPVEIHAATKSGARVSFRQVHGPSGKRVRYEKTVPGIGPVDTSEIMKGYESGDDIILLEPEEVNAIRLETKKTLELVQFVGTSEIAPLWYDRPYYVIPADDLAEDAYRVVRDALREAERVGLGQLTMRGREYLCAIRPCGDGLLLETLHYADEVREAEPLFSGIADDPADKELLSVARQLIERKTAPFDASAFEDHYDQAMRALIESKTKSRTTKRVARDESGASRPEGENVVDLMDALKKSLSAAGGKGSGSRRGAAAKSSGTTKAKPAAKPASGDKPATRSPAKTSSAKTSPAKTTKARKQA